MLHLAELSSGGILFLGLDISLASPCIPADVESCPCTELILVDNFKAGEK